jgi:hypothetical protein
MKARTMLTRSNPWCLKKRDFAQRYDDAAFLEELGDDATVVRKDLGNDGRPVVHEGVDLGQVLVDVKVARHQTQPAEEADHQQEQEREKDKALEETAFLWGP